MRKADFINACSRCRREMQSGDKDVQLIGFRRLKILESMFEGSPMLKKDANCMGAFTDTEHVWEQAVAANRMKGAVTA